MHKREGGVFQTVGDYNRSPSTGPRSAWVSAAFLLGFIGLCFAVGGIAGAVTDPNLSAWYDKLVRPPATPPNWVFPVVWSSQYVLIGTAAWLVWQRRAGRRALWPWFVQLVFNFLWSPAFFGLHSPVLGLVVIAPLLATVVLTIRSFAQVRPLAAWLMVPYLIWGSYATYLNIGFFYLNRS